MASALGAAPTSRHRLSAPKERKAEVWGWRRCSKSAQGGLPDEMGFDQRPPDEEASCEET